MVFYEWCDVWCDLKAYYVRKSDQFFGFVSLWGVMFYYSGTDGSGGDTFRVMIFLL